MKLNFDDIVIGSGIAGMTAAIYLKRAGRNVLIIEKNVPGGQILRSFQVENYPGFISIDGPTLAMNVYSQVTNLKIPYEYGEVTEVNNNDSYLIVKTNSKEMTCQNVIVATGREPRELPLSNFNTFVGKGISYCALCDGMFFKDENVIVVGGGNSALEDALYLSSICKNVKLVVRRDILRADDILVEEVKNKNNINILYHSEVTEIKGTDKVTSVILNNKQEIDCSGLFIAIGSIPNSKFLSTLQLENEDGYLIVNEKMQTNHPHIYACGDAIKKDVYQLTTAVGEATMASANIK